MKFSAVIIYEKFSTRFTMYGFETAERAAEWAKDFSRKCAAETRWEVIASNYN
jgi:hypothetical protein